MIFIFIVYFIFMVYFNFMVNINKRILFSITYSFNTDHVPPVKI